MHACKHTHTHTYKPDVVKAADVEFSKLVSIILASLVVAVVMQVLLHCMGYFSRED